MLYIPTNVKINLEWAVKKGAGNEAEDFSRATVSLFVTSDRNRWAVPCRADFAGVVRAELPELLPEGVYSLELVWVKNDKYLGMRCLQRTRKVCVFAVSDGVALPQGATEGEPVLLRMSTVAAPYGYDGLSAYEICVLRGKTTLSEEEWAESLCGGNGPSPTPPASGTLTGGGNCGYNRPLTLTWTATQIPSEVVIKGDDGFEERFAPASSMGNVVVTPTRNCDYYLYLNGSDTPEDSTSVRPYHPVYMASMPRSFNANNPDMSLLQNGMLATFGPCKGTKTFSTSGDMEKICIAVPSSLQIRATIFGADYLADMVKVNNYQYDDPVAGITVPYTIYTNPNAANNNGVSVDYEVTL